MEIDGMFGPDFFDDPAIFEMYISNRSDPASLNETLEKPVLMELIGEIRGLRVLDLGCGDARIGLEFLENGQNKYVGVEGSRNMASLAQETLAGTSAGVHHSKIEDWTFPKQDFDLVISRLALHYLEDLRAVFGKVYGSLVPAGRFIFSVEHPVITSSDRSQGRKQQGWIVDNYFVTGARQRRVMSAEVIKYHRTFEEYFMDLLSAGFQVDAVRESKPRPALFADEKTYERWKRIPLMLFFSASRPIIETK
jgi:SAM-dependent methyltransferase